MLIRIQCCGLAVMLVLMYFYKSQKKLKLGTGRAYWQMFCTTFVSIALDIVSCMAIVNMSVLPKIVVGIICKTYLVSLMTMAVFMLSYVCTELFPVRAELIRTMKLYFIVATICYALIYAAPISFFYDAEKQHLYTYGPSVLTTYAFAFMALLLTVWRLTTAWKKMSKSRRDAVLIGILIIFTAVAVQFFNNSLLLVSFASSISMVVSFIKLENPGYNIDTRTGLFNQNAFNLYATQLYKNQNDFAIIDIIYDPNVGTATKVDETLIEVMNYLSTLPNVLAFKSIGSEVFILTEDSAGSEVLLEKLRRRFAEGWGRDHDVVVNPYWIYVPDPYIVKTVLELVNLLRYVRINSTELSETHLATVDEALAAKLGEEKEMSELIISALNDDRVEVYYQPIYSTKERIFTAAEALVRIRGEDGNIIPPGRFVKVAESNGLILKLGEAVFRKVCEFIRDNDLRSIGLRYIEVNLSVIQCGCENLADDFIRIMEQYNISSDMVNFEITESASLDTKSVMLQNMHKLLDFGVNFSLDDFGTGQSNLNYIIDMPVEIVKFDREMTNAYFENSKAKYIMDAAMDMIHGMDLDIVSEGVETKEQLQIIEQLNISYVQGFYFSKPLPAREFVSFISERNLQ